MLDSCPSWAVIEEVDNALRSADADECVAAMRETSGSVRVAVMPLHDVPPTWREEMAHDLARMGRPMPPGGRWLVTVDEMAGDQLLIFEIVPGVPVTRGDA